jgi:dihydroxyacetone kinase-like protein
VTCTVTRDQVVEWLTECAREIADHKAYLVDLDAAIGDGDHGINMDRGFRAVLSRLAGLSGSDLGTLLKTVGMTLISTVGGAAGPLYGTFFLRAAGTAEGTEELDAAGIETMLQEGVKGVMDRGRAKPGDKTMVDALAPAVEALSTALAQGRELPEAVQLCVSAAEHGVQSTIPMQAKKGRASYLGERSVGHIDPGAMSSYYLLQALGRIVAG